MCKWRTNLFYSFFQYLGDIPSTPGELFSFILLILLTTTFGVTTNCPNLSPSDPLNFVSGTGYELVSSHMNTELKYIFNSSAITNPSVVTFPELSSSGPTLSRTWLKSPIIIQSPLLTSLIALCIVLLFYLVMLGQRYTTPMVTIVCPVTKLHHMASLQSGSPCNCTSYAGIVSLMYNNTPPSSNYAIPIHYITFQSQFNICYIIVCP